MYVYIYAKVHTYVCNYIHDYDFANLILYTVPSALTANITKDIESSSLVVQWDAMEDFIETIYTIRWDNRTNYTPKVVTVTEQTSYTITGLTLDTVYTITVSAGNNCGNGPEFITSILLAADNTSTISSITPTVTTSTNSMTAAFNSKSSTIITTAINKTPDAASTPTGTNVLNTTTASITTIIVHPNTTTNVVVSPTNNATIANATASDTTSEFAYTSIRS